MIIGHQKQWQFLKKSAEREKLSHAYLFSGQEKLGKKTIALEFIKFLFGQDPQNPPHPDFILVEPIAKEIQISQIRDLIWKLTLKPLLAPLKVALIDQAHLMNKEAQNCFLKTLEEPKGKTLLILITEYPEILFPTILSRVQKLRFWPVKKSEIESYLKSQGISEKETREITRISMGRPGIAVDFVKSPQKLEARKKIIKELVEIIHSDLVYRFQYAKELSKDFQNLKETLDIWLSYFRDLLLERCLVFPLKLSDRENERAPSFLKLKNILKQIQSTNFLISTTNVNPRLALEILMLEL